MPHRGRLAFLVSQLNYPVRRLLYKIQGKTEMPAGKEGEREGGREGEKVISSVIGMPSLIAQLSRATTPV